MNAIILRSLALTILYAFGPCCLASAPAQPGDLFAKLEQEAEERYQQSSNDKKQDAEPAATETAAAPAPEVKPPVEQKPWSFLDYARSPSKPIVIQHKQFSDDWWKNLWANCKGCKERNEPISCPKMMADNPQWEEVLAMSREARAIVMARALKRFVKEDDACNLACALCAGGEPDQRVEGENFPHTGLHLASGDSPCNTKAHYGLFRLLLEKGANPNMKCTTRYPWHYARTWRDDLKKHGGKEQSSDY